MGKHIVEQLLDRGYGVHVLARGKTPTTLSTSAKLTFFRGDILDVRALKEAADVDVIFHVAAKAGIWGPYQSFFDCNVVGTRNVIKVCREKGISSLVYTSSPSVVFGEHSIRGANESLPYPTRFLSSYAETKAIAEREILAANGEKLTTVALRPHLIWGNGDNHLIPTLLRKASRLRIVGDGRNQVDITHVENAAHAHLLALDALETVAGRAFFLAQEKPVLLWEWINDLLKLFGKSPIRKQIPFPLAYAAGAFCDSLAKLCPNWEPPMTRFLARQLAQDHYFDLSAAKKHLGYSPKVSIIDGMTALKNH